MNELKCYKTKDGRIFENKKDAIMHEARINIEERLLTKLENIPFGSRDKYFSVLDELLHKAGIYEEILPLVILYYRKLEQFSKNSCGNRCCDCGYCL